MCDQDRLLTASVTGFHASFFSAQEVLKTSVLRITNPVALDALGHGAAGCGEGGRAGGRAGGELTRGARRGLYDPSLGPVEQGSALCPTCHLTAKECPGHMGHIELDVPVYHPLLFPTLFLLLRHKCLACHRCVHARTACLMRPSRRACETCGVCGAGSRCRRRECACTGCGLCCWTGAT